MMSPNDSGKGAAETVRAAIMQPYFLPYIGYFQLMREVDVFVVYDNIKYTKKGWINRNRLLLNDEPAVFSLPLKSDSDQLDVRDRTLAPQFDPRKMLAQIHGAYRKAPHFDEFFPVVGDIFGFESKNLFNFIFNSIDSIRKFLRIDTALVVSSQIDADHSKSGQDRVLEICRQLGANRYLNPPGGRALYAREAFESRGIELAFLSPRLLPYSQFGADFVPALSILDVLMFNPIERVVNELLPAYDVILPDIA